jgi:hypothetical protein
MGKGARCQALAWKALARRGCDASATTPMAAGSEVRSAVRCMLWLGTI